MAAKLTNKEAVNKRNWKVGQVVECIHSASNAYTKGKKYKVVEDYLGRRCLIGDDGLEDLLSMLVSEFRMVE